MIQNCHTKYNAACQIELQGTVQIKKFGNIWDSMLYSNINLSNHNNFLPAEPVSRVSETQPQDGRKLQNK